MHPQRQQSLRPIAVFVVRAWQSRPPENAWGGSSEDNRIKNTSATIYEKRRALTASWFLPYLADNPLNSPDWPPTCRLWPRVPCFFPTERQTGMLRRWHKHIGSKNLSAAGSSVTSGLHPILRTELIRQIQSTRRVVRRSSPAVVVHGRKITWIRARKRLRIERASRALRFHGDRIIQRAK